MRSISELKVREYEQRKEVDFKIIQLTAAYLTSLVENPDSLAVDASYWQQLAEIIATADCLQYVHRVRLVKISDQVTGLIADVQLNYAIVAQDRFLPESELYYVAHNTNFSSCVSICKQGAFRPSKWDQDDVTWFPPLTFYARGHLTHESVAFRKAAEYKSDARPSCILARAKTRQVGHAKPESGGTHTDLTTVYFRDILRSKDGHWAFRCSVAKPTGIAIWVYQ